MSQMEDDDYIDLTTIEQECLLYRLVDYPWIVENLMPVHYPPALVCHAMVLTDMVEDAIIPKELCQMSKDIFRLCIEKSDWLEAPGMFPGGGGHPIPVMKKALRDTAGKLEGLGVEITHLPG